MAINDNMNNIFIKDNLNRESSVYFTVFTVSSLLTSEFHHSLAGITSYIV